MRWPRGATQLCPQTDLADADVVIVYGVPSIMAELSDRLAASLRPGALVASNVFECPQSAEQSAERSAEQSAERSARLSPLCAPRWLASSAPALDHDSGWHVYRASGSEPPAAQVHALDE